MRIEGRKVLVLGGYGLVGTAVCRELLEHAPREIQIHSLRREETERAREDLRLEAGNTTLSMSSGDIFGLSRDVSRREQIAANLSQLQDDELDRYLLYQVLIDSRAEIVIDCVNSATAIAYRDLYGSAQRLWQQLGDDSVDSATVEEALDALYVPRLIRHIQILYHGLLDAGVHVYLKIGTSGTGGMGLNVPYTHSEEKPSRSLLSKSALAGAHSMLLFLMARTPGGPIIKEIKPAAAIAWKSIGYGPIVRRGEPIRLVKANPQPLGTTFSTHDPTAGELSDAPLETVYIDTGENGLFSLEEFALLTTARQMEFVTPEEIARHLVFEIEGGNTGHDIINALDNTVFGPTYRAGVMRNRALTEMVRLEQQGDTRSVAFEMLGPPRNSKLLFETHLLREAFGTMAAVRQSTAQEVVEKLNNLLAEKPQLGQEIAAIGIPVLFADGRLLRGPSVIVPSQCSDELVDEAKIDRWAETGWVDLRPNNCARWVARFQKIHDEVMAIPRDDSSSRYLRRASFWNEEHSIQPGKIVSWILSEEEHGARFKR